MTAVQEWGGAHVCVCVCVPQRVCVGGLGAVRGLSQGVMKP